MKMQVSRRTPKDPFSVHDYKQKIKEISNNPSALQRFKKIEAVRLEIVKRLSHAKRPEPIEHGIEIFGIVTALLGCASIVATAFIMSAYVVPTGSSFILISPGLTMVIIGIIITNMGEFEQGISRLERKEQRNEITHLSHLVEEMEKIEGKIISDHGAEIVEELRKSNSAAIRENFPRLKECLLAQSQP
jgi:hypothetical protein